MKKIKTRNKFETKLVKQAQSSPHEVTYESEKIPYVIEGNYIPDIIIHNKKKIYLEAKGHFRPEAKRKMVAVKKQHPELDIRIVFYSYNKKYIRWANKYGFPFAIGDIPDEWLL